MRVKKALPFLIIILAINACQPAQLTQPVFTRADTEIMQETRTAQATLRMSPALTNTITMANTPTQKQIGETTFSDLPKGRYIVYEAIGRNGSAIHAITDTGSDDKVIYKDSSGITIDLSKDQKYILMHVRGREYINLYSIEKATTTTIPDKDNCINEYIYVNTSWGPDGRVFAMRCGYQIDIISVPDGEVVGEIRNHNYGDENHLLYPTWSPNGKWMVFELSAADKMDPDKGTFVVNTSCIINHEPCNYIFRLIPYIDTYEMKWTPDSQLAVMTSYNTISVYDLDLFRIVKEIQIPLDIGGLVDSFAWSPDGEWIALETNMGICVMSITTGETRIIAPHQDGTIKFWLEIK